MNAQMEYRNYHYTHRFIATLPKLKKRPMFIGGRNGYAFMTKRRADGIAQRAYDEYVHRLREQGALSMETAARAPTAPRMSNLVRDAQEEIRRKLAAAE